MCVTLSKAFLRYTDKAMVASAGRRHSRSVPGVQGPAYRHRSRRITEKLPDEALRRVIAARPEQKKESGSAPPFSEQPAVRRP